MPLPKINQPIHSLTIPTTNKKIRFRPFTVKEEKLLLTVKEDPDFRSIANVLKQIVNNCVLDTVDVERMAAIDLQYIFVQIRSKSVSNIAEIKYKDPEDGKDYPVEIDLDAVRVENLNTERKITLTDKVGVVLRHPSFHTLEQLASADKDQYASVILRSCIETIWDGDTVYAADDFEEAEVDEFIESLSPRELQKFENFFGSMAELVAEATYVRADKQKVTREIRGLNNFF